MTGIAVLCAALAAVVVVALSGAAGSGTRRGCLDVSFASSLGVQEVVRCGPAARAACAAVGTPAGFSGPIGRLLAADCRRLGLPVG